MHIPRYMLVCLAWCCPLLILSYLSEVDYLGPLYLRDYSTGSSPSNFPLNRSEEKEVYFQGEVFIPEKIEHEVNKGINRTGLKLLSSLYHHLPSVNRKYSSVSPEVEEFIKKLKEDLEVRGVARDPWDLARKWATPNEVVPRSAPGLGDLLAALSTARITGAEPCALGSKLKVLITLEGNQTALFKPMRYSRDAVIRKDGEDRHNAEIAAFHLGRILDNRMVPVAAGRVVAVAEELRSVAQATLAGTFYADENNETCFYGVCYYCRRTKPVCTTRGLLEGVVILWFPDHLPVVKFLHPWRSKYRTLAEWETDSNYCEKVIKGQQSSRILDFMDESVFDFLIQNGIRYHAVYVKDEANSSLVPMDNGKSLGDPSVDHMDLLAPLLQCCRIRQAMYDRLVLLSGGGMSWALREVLAHDPVSPVLSDAHLRAIDRRVTHVLAALSACSEKEGGWHNVLS
ncbi:glycosaminoglycan xylosylkinase-like isoform X2 [Penaeus vannamei]|uniref:glycosaminoglycan xylosylkinase-like isoform X2 n=1 Tax=Penaeus vannamei TaxID=6689 RepID=UPI00387F57D8